MDPETEHLLPSGERVEEGFDSSYSVLRHRLANPEPSIPIEQVAAELGLDLDELLGDADLPTSQPPRS